jgi:hypothetical protein
VASVDDAVGVLSEGSGLHEGSNASTRIYDGERVWHLTFCVRERHELAPRQAQIGLTLNERRLLGEERSLPRVACRLARRWRWRFRRLGLGERRRPVAGRPRLASSTTFGGGDLIDVELDDGTGAVISARVEVVDQTDGLARGRIVAVADDGGRRLGALVDRLRNSPSDGEPQPEPLPALREALAAARRLRG